MIGQNINQLINIAESQSDERLAQELNPQTETGMLGPTWLPASELSFRQKIRAEAQAQPQNNPPIVQQLAQSVMPPMMPQQQMMPPPQQMMPQQPMMPPQQQMPMAPAGMSAQSQMPPQMFASGGSVKDVLLPDFSSIETLMQGLGGGVGVSDEGTAKWWNPVAGLPHVQYANLQTTGEPMIGLPLGNIGNITQDVSEWAGVYKPPFEQWDQETIDKYLAKQKEENNMSGGGLLENMSGIGVMKNAMEGDMSMMGFLPLLYNQFKGDKDEEEEEAIPMSAGGLVRYAHGGRTEGATKAEQSVLRSLWDKMTRGQKEEMMSEPSEDAHVPFNSYEEARRYKEFIDSPEWEQLVPGGSYEEPPRMSAGGLVKFANGGDVLPSRSMLEDVPFWEGSGPARDLMRLFGIGQGSIGNLRDQIGADPEGFRMFKELDMKPYGESIDPYTSVDPDELEYYRQLATDRPLPEGISPKRASAIRRIRQRRGYGTEEETEKETSARQINQDLRDSLNLIQKGGGKTGEWAGTEETHDRMTKAEDFYEGLMPESRPTGGPLGRSLLQKMREPDALTMSRHFANNPEDYKWLTDLQEEHGDLEGLLRFSEDRQTPIEEIEVTGEKIIPIEEIEVTAKKRPVVESVAELDGIDIKAKPGDNQGRTNATNVTYDQIKGIQQDLDTQLEEIMKPLLNQDNQMNRKWMAIAAGAFNAAQKGAPTLMAGLADLGGGVTTELQNLDKEDQARAEALFDIYYKRQTLAETRRKTDLTYSAAMAGHQMDLDASRYTADISWAKSVADRLGKSVDDVLKATNQWDAAKKNKTLAQFGTEDYVGSIIDYMGQGVQSAGLEYNQMIGNLSRKEQEIIADIPDFDPDNEEHRAEVLAEFTEYLEDNPDMKMLHSDYWSKRVAQDEEGKPMPFDMTSFLTIRPPLAKS